MKLWRANAVLRGKISCDRQLSASAFRALAEVRRWSRLERHARTIHPWSSRRPRAVAALRCAQMSIALRERTAETCIRRRGTPSAGLQLVAPRTMLMIGRTHFVSFFGSGARAAHPPSSPCRMVLKRGQQRACSATEGSASPRGRLVKDLLSNSNLECEPRPPSGSPASQRPGRTIAAKPTLAVKPLSIAQGALTALAV
jgi:hypothetical protein